MHGILPSCRFGKKCNPNVEDCLHIETLGLKVRSKILHFQPSNLTWGEHDEYETARSQVPPSGEAFSMHNVLSMDLETCSVANMEGRFMVYAVWVSSQVDRLSPRRC